jgi:uncharacterized membrane protein YfcA
LILFALLGVLFGVVGGMGLGGGIVLIPALTLFMGISQHEAQGMTLFAYLPMAAAALVSHFHQKNVSVKPALFLTLFGCVGGAGGYWLASATQEDVLRMVFAVFLIIAALLRVWRGEIAPWLKRKKSNDKTRQPRRP